MSKMKPQASTTRHIHLPASYSVILNSIWPFPKKHVWDRYDQYYETYMQVRLTAIPNYIGERIAIPSGLHIKAWRTLVKDYHDQQLEFGWPVDYTADTPPVTVVANHHSGAENVEHMDEYIKTELAHGSLLGPFDASPFMPWTCMCIYMYDTDPYKPI